MSVETLVYMIVDAMNNVKKISTNFNIFDFCEY